MRVTPLLFATACCVSQTRANDLAPRTAASSLSAPSASSASYPTSPTSSFSTTQLPPSSTDQGEPQITQAPDVLDGDVSMQLQDKYHQTTYWSCVTIATQVACGWHEPILPGGDEIPGAAPGRASWGAQKVVGVVVAVVGVLMR